MVNSQRGTYSAELAITSLISNKREWNNCFIKFLKLQKFEVRNTSEKIRAKWKKNFMKMRCCVTPFSINLLVVYRESVNLIGYLTRRLSADSLQL